MRFGFGGQSIGGSSSAPGLLSRRSRKRKAIRKLSLRTESLEVRHVLASSVMISEFQASNATTLADTDGDFSDWIELHNTTSAPVDITGWHLTDNDTNLTKWTFPETTIEPNGYLVVFASSKNYTTPGEELHTNFAISANGEYLALVESDGLTIATEFSPEFPAQREDQSYGFGVTRDSVRLVEAGAPVKVFVPTNDSLGTSWTGVGFNDSAWTSGTTGVGYEQLAAGFTQRDDFSAPLGAAWTTDNPAGSTATVNVTGGEVVMAVPAQHNTLATRGLAPVIYRDIPSTTANFTASTRLRYTAGTGGAGGITLFDAQAERPVMSIEVNRLTAAVHLVQVTVNGAIIRSVPATGVSEFFLNMQRNQLDDTWTMSWARNATTAPTTVLTLKEGVDMPQVDDPRVGLMTRTTGTASITSNFDFFQLDTQAEPAVYGPLTGTNVEAAMFGNNASIYTRIPFTVDEDPGRFDELTLSAQFDDGFVAYLNGVQITAQNSAVGATWNSTATTTHGLSGGTVVNEVFNLHQHVGLLQQGNNVLAIHGLNIDASDKDFFLRPALTVAEVLPAMEQFFTSPTPGAENAQPAAPVPVISAPSGTFTGSQIVELSLSTPVDNTEIRYTTDGTEPTLESTLYTAPITLTASTFLRARSFDTSLIPSYGPSNIAAATYTLLSNAVSTFSSNLPILVLDTQGSVIPPSEGVSLQRGLITLYDVDPVTGRATFDPDNVDYAGTGGLRRRGSSTAGIAKGSYKLETWGLNSLDIDDDVSLLGMPADSDWVLYSPYDFDRSLIHEPFIYGLSNDLGSYASRTRYIEVYNNENGGAIDSGDYWGVYILQEKIKRHPDRVDVAELSPTDNAEPEITGGYVWSIDRAAPGEPQFSAGGQNLNWIEPQVTEVSPEQVAYATGYINEFVNVLNGPDFADPENGYAKYIEVDSWIDHHLMNVFAFNVDALRLSAYLYKDRGGKIEFGPLWDFDRSMESTDGRDNNPNVWRSTVPDFGTDFFGYPWWGRLFQDPSFWQKYVDRWHELRQGELSDEAIDARVDAEAAQLTEAQARHFARWTAVTPRSAAALPFSDVGGWQGEIENVRNFLKARAKFMDENFAPVPQFELNGLPLDERTQGVVIDPGDVLNLIAADAPPTVITEDTVLLAGTPGALSGSYFVPADNSLGTSWTTLGFDDSSWRTGSLGIGYETAAADYASLLFTQVNPNTEVTGATSILVRTEFSLGDLSEVEQLLLQMKYDDGFVAYINGTEVARANVAGDPTWNGAAADHPDGSAVVFESFDITPHIGLLNPSGPNVLAIHVMNSGPTSSDLLIQPQFAARTTTVIPAQESAGAIYYTTDGTDPRGPDGNPSATAIPYNPVASLVPAGGTVSYLVPTGAGSESGWQNISYNDSSWNTGTSALGFDNDTSGINETGQPGFFVRVANRTSGQIGDIGTATGMLDGTIAYVGTETTGTFPNVNFFTNGDGDFGSGVRPPGLTGDTEDYAIRATAAVTIPPGTYTIAAASDDGVSVTIPGVVFTNTVNQEFTSVPNRRDDQIVFGAPRGNAQTMGTFTVVGEPLETTVELDFYERGGGDTVELSIASGQQTAFNTTLFSLLSNGSLGWSVRAAEIVSNRVDYSPQISTNVSSAMQGTNSSLYARYEFTAADVDQIKALTMTLQYDDGFVAYLNGTEIARQNAPASLSFNSAAPTVRADGLALQAEEYDLADHIDLLQNGNNVLAIHALNQSASNTDFLIAPTLSAVYFGSPITLTENTRIVARNFDTSDRGPESRIVGTDWSAPVVHDFIVASPELVITEINYNPTEDTELDEFGQPVRDSDAFEFIEIQNTGSTTADLTGVQLTNGVSFDFSASGVTSLGAGQRMVLVSDLEAFQSRYGTGIPVAGVFSDNLANTGERLTLSDGLGQVLFSVEYGDSDPWPNSADGAGTSLVLVDATKGDKYYGWRASTEFGGSPGTASAAPLGVVINEVLTRTDAADTFDAIELLNTTNAPINIGGWYLSDSAGNLLKFQIPAGTVLFPGQHIVFDESDFNTGDNGFALNSSEGEEVFLTIANGDAVVSFSDSVAFGAANDLESFARYPNGTGRLAPQSRLTLGCTNTIPRVGPLVISEVQYAPGEPTEADLAIYAELNSGDLEFIELHNPTSEAVSLENWEIRGGVDFDLSGSLAAGGTLLILSFNPTDPVNADRTAAFLNHYGLTAGAVTMVGGYAGQLDSNGERVTLHRPDAPPANQPGLIPDLIEDEVLFDNVAPWATGAPGAGVSLQRKAAIYYGNAATSWNAGAATPGTVNFNGNLPGDFNGDGLINATDIDALTIAILDGSTVLAYDVDGSGFVDAADHTHMLQTVIGTARGDANLDGFVDASDFNRWNVHKFSDCFVGWGQGDFNGDGSSDASDFNLWNSNKFQAAGATAATARAPRAPLARTAIAVAPNLADSVFSRIDATRVRELATTLETASQDAGDATLPMRVNRARLASRDRRLSADRATTDQSSQFASLVDDVLARLQS
jgi:hypothetical protein